MHPTPWPRHLPARPGSLRARRLATSVVLVALAASAAPAASTATTATTATTASVAPVDPVSVPPNVVLIISDDQAWTDFGFMGHDAIRTPHIDRLAAEGVTFPHGYVPTSLCRPSLMSMATGLYPHQHRIVGNDPPRGVDRGELLRHIRAAPTVAKALAARGYTTHQSGKWWEGSHRLGGFTHGMTHGDPKRGGRHGDVGLQIGRKGLDPIFEHIRAHRDRPFFVWYAPFLPHTPHNPPARLLAKHTREGRSPRVARYYAMCEWLDETCGELLGFLRKEGLRENTLVAFVVDNGWTPQARAAGSWRSKRTPYDAGIRTPIILSWPGRIRPARIDTTVSSVDLAPTILRACGVVPDARMSGVDLLSLAAGAEPARPGVFGATFTHDMADVDAPARSLQYRWCRIGRWKLIVPAMRVPITTYEMELFDIADDPRETVNLAYGNRRRVREMLATLDAWWKPDHSRWTAPPAATRPPVSPPAASPAGRR